MKIYAYVTTETCRNRDAVKPGSIVDGRKIHRHGDYTPWVWAQSDTRRRVESSLYTPYVSATAKAVEKLLGWDSDMKEARNA